MKFTIIIPVFNAGAKIKPTLASILAQTALQEGRCDMQCVVVDGASSDRTLEYARSFDDPRIRVISEPDTGMYDALSKGLALADGDVSCYLPAGEAFDPNAFRVVTRIFERYPEISWLTGRAVLRNAAGDVTTSDLPHPYRRHFVDSGLHGTRLTGVQQESTFWRTQLNAEFDFEVLRGLRLAGDYYLWRCLARTQELYVVNSQLASFTIEPGQLSRREPGAYRKELRTLRRKPTLFERCHALLLRQYTKRALPHKRSVRLVSYDHEAKDWVLAKR